MPNIVIVDDNPADQTLIAEAFREAFKGKDYASTLHLFADGDSALNFLAERQKRSLPERPGLVVLDLNLPGKHGFEVLTEIKSDPNMKNIPVVVFTTSDSRDDVERAYARHANSYIIKPMGLDRLFTVIDQMKRYWFDTVERPEAVLQ